MICLDTHVLLWWTLEPERLSPRALRAVDEADGLAVSSIVFWEIALLARRQKVHLGTSIAVWTREVLSLTRIESLPLLPETAVAAESLTMHADPADRFIVATAIHRGLSLVTKDAAIRRSGLVPTIW
jgi:PIN domain nuclease of toxin-antitoxin system